MSFRTALYIEAPSVVALDRDEFSKFELRDLVSRLALDKVYLDGYRGVDNLSRSVTKPCPGPGCRRAVR